MSKKFLTIIWIAICIITIILIGVCIFSIVKSKVDEIVHPEVTFEIENYGTVKMELYPEYAPNTVSNFIKLIQNGYYDNKIVYGKDDVCLYIGRDSNGDVQNPKLSLIDNSVEADSDSDYEYTIKGEFIANGFKQNTLSHDKGVVSLIRNDYSNYSSNLTEESYNSGNSQIGVMMNNNRNLNGVYAGFAKVTEGLDILEKIYNEAEIKNDDSEEAEGSIQAFNNNITITSAKVDTFGLDYGMPVVQKAFDYQSYLYNMLSNYYSNE